MYFSITSTTLHIAKVFALLSLPLSYSSLSSPSPHILLIFLLHSIPLGNINPQTSQSIHLSIYYRRMYFKQRQRSSLYKRQQQIEQARLLHKLQEIKQRKLRPCDSENRLPLITHRTSQPRPCQKVALQMETQRLSKRIMQLKTNKSQYFDKVIGLNLSSEYHHGKKQLDDKSSLHCNKSNLQLNK